MKKVNYKSLNILIILAIVYVLFLMRDLWIGVFFKVLAVLKPFIIAFAMAYSIYPFLRWLQSKKIPKFFAILIILVILALFIFFVVISLVPVFTDQLVSLFGNIMKFVSEMGSKYDIDIAPIQTNLSTIFNTISSNVSKYISDGAINLVNSSISFVSNSIIVLVVFIYFLIDMDKIRDNVDEFFSKKSKKTYKLVQDIDHETTSYFKGLFLTILIQFFEYTIVFYLIGHPNFLLLGVLSSVSTLIPYFGGLIVNIIALIIASVVSPQLFVMTLIVAIVFPNIDGYLISPKIYGKTNNISPLLSIFAVFAGGVLGGFVGILIALPLTIILRTIYQSYKKDISKKIGNIRGKL